MIKQTLYFGNPAYLSVRRRQLEIRQPRHGQKRRHGRGVRGSGEEHPY